MKILITGGSGFIGSALIRWLYQSTSHDIVNLDKLTYAGNNNSLSAAALSSRYTFLNLDICDRELVHEALQTHGPDLVMHLAAESHVDRSIDGPADFVQTNLVGTFELLEATRGIGRGYQMSNGGNFAFCTSQRTKCSVTWGQPMTSLPKLHHMPRVLLTLLPKRVPII